MGHPNSTQLNLICKDELRYVKARSHGGVKFAAILARKITGATRSEAKGGFWDSLAYTRVLHSALEEFGLKGYFEANHRERELGAQAREAYLSHWNRYIRRLRGTRALPQKKTLSILTLS